MTFKDVVDWFLTNSTEDLRIFTQADYSAYEKEDTLKQCAYCSANLRKVRNVVDKMEQALSAVKAEETYISGVLIPRLMAEANVRSFTLEDGSAVTCRETVFASMPKTDEQARKRALDWLNANGGGTLIKDTLTVESPNEELLAMVDGRFKAERKKDVNTNSLKSFVSELLGYKKGSVAQMELEELPPELHAFVKRDTVIKE